MRMKKVIILLIAGSAIFFLLKCSNEEKNHIKRSIDVEDTKTITKDWMPTWNESDWKRFHEEAIKESMIPVRPGKPGKSPFWNAYARRFINVPSFDFNSVKGAIKYRFEAKSDANSKEYSFETKNTWDLLTPIWEKLPVGLVYLTVKGLNEEDEVIGVAGKRRFYRAAVFNGPYQKPVMDYKSSAVKNLKLLFEQRHVQRWLTEKTPDTNFTKYCYPSKTEGAIIQGMTMYSKLCPENDKEKVLLIAKNVAKHLMNLSQPAGSPLEYFPPTYVDLGSGAKYYELGLARKRKDQIMMVYPAHAGNAYLDLFEVTREKEFYNAAIRIADTYQKLQLDSGTWPLMIYLYTGKASTKDLLIPKDVIKYFNRLINDYDMKQYTGSREKAFNWMMENPMKSFKWEGQFEDATLSTNYSNLEQGKPLNFAQLLFERAPEHPEYIELAEELIRFAEDQFVVWEKPLPREMFRTPTQPVPGIRFNSDKWLTPCVLEQYGWFLPVDGNICNMISTCQMAFEVTGKELYLVKACSLADNLTYFQKMGGGIYSNYTIKTAPRTTPPANWNGWINGSIHTSLTMLRLGNYLEIKNKH